MVGRNVVCAEMEWDRLYNFSRMKGMDRIQSIGEGIKSLMKREIIFPLAQMMLGCVWICLL